MRTTEDSTVRHLRRVRRGHRTLGFALAAAVLAAVLAGALSCSDQGTAPDPNNVTPPPVCGHVDNAYGVVLVARADTLVRLTGFSFDGHYPNVIHLAVGASLDSIAVTFLDFNSQPIVIPSDCTINALDWLLTNPSLAAITQDPGLPWSFNIRGTEVGSTTLAMRIRHDTHWHYTSEPIPLVVGP